VRAAVGGDGGAQGAVRGSGWVGVVSFDSWDQGGSNGAKIVVWQWLLAGGQRSRKRSIFYRIFLCDAEANCVGVSSVLMSGSGWVGVVSFDS
jgi:hypothetical protein